MSGKRSGIKKLDNSCRKQKRRQPRDLDFLGAFVREDGGYTSIAIAAAMLVSIVLVLALTQVSWSKSKAADVQAIADATAISGCEPVKAFSTVAQVSDACVLSLGLAGTIVLGSGLVVSLIPGLASVGTTISNSGSKILTSRRDFAKSAEEGLRALESTLPALITTNSYLTATANSSDETRYTGIALPFPFEGSSSYDVADDIDSSKLGEEQTEIASESNKSKEAFDKMTSSQERAWEADCVDSPLCLRSRADTLAHLSALDNPGYASPESWSFAAPIKRARKYYSKRVQSEIPQSGSVEEKANSAMRKVFYEYALKEMNSAYYREESDNTDIYIPHLAHNTETTRNTSLYNEVKWPISVDGDSKILHAYETCPGINGGITSRETLSTCDKGDYKLCPQCRMSTVAMGKVASASTNINNGFEYYLKIIADEADKYKEAKEEYDSSNKNLKKYADESGDLFQEAIDSLGCKRPKLCPSGAYGCISIVVRESRESAEELVSKFLSGFTLPPGAAIAGATLAPDNSTSDNTVLTRIFDSILPEGSTSSDIGKMIMGLWSDLLSGYGSICDSVISASDSLFDRLSEFGFSSISDALKGKIKATLEAFGMESADLRCRKPTLCNSQDILDADGSSGRTEIREWIQKIPYDASPKEILTTFAKEVTDKLKCEEFKIAELTIPGTDIKIPLKISIGKFLKEVI